VTPAALVGSVDEPGPSALMSRVVSGLIERGEPRGAGIERSYDPPMDRKVEEWLADGDAAIGAGRWAEARAAFERVLAEGDPLPAALYGLGEALWWLGEIEPGIRSVERSFAEFRRRGEHERAAAAAMQLCGAHRSNFGNLAASAGWLGRAESLVEQFGLESLRGWLLLTRAGDASDPADAVASARLALVVARADADLDLELCALSQIGFALVGQGRIAEGLRCLDEAMAGSLAGEPARMDTVVLVSCQMIIACARGGDAVRATQWVRAAEDFISRYGCPFLHATCRTQYGAVLFQTGRWDQADQELRAAVGSSRGSLRALRGEALAALAELSLARGEVEAAERLIAGFTDDPAAVRVVAALRLRRGEPALAAGVVHRRLDEIGERTLEAGRLLELLCAAQFDLAEYDAAVATAARLAALGADVGCDELVARGQRALGRTRLHQADHGAARRHLETALAAFARLEFPYETARARLSLALALSADAGTRDLAVVEARAALGEFESLGAGGDADAAAAQLRDLGERAARSGPPGQTPLTKREQEILQLLGEGLSNPAIAERLFITRKTVEHHVSHILAKLDLSSRSAAAAYAVRNVLEIGELSDAARRHGWDGDRMSVQAQTYDPVAYKAEMVAGFSSVAGGYGVHLELTERIWGPIGERLLNLADVRSGARVLDVATGAGGLALAAARRVGAAGHVLGTDASPQMIETARLAADADSVANADFRVVDADDADLPAASFDAAICRYALNFFFDLDSALAGILRSLVPGGKLAACVVGPPEELPFASLIMGAIVRSLDVPPPPEPPAGAPHFFSLSDPRLLTDALTRAGFTDVRAERLEYGGTFESGAELAEWTVAVNPFFKALVDAKPHLREACLAAIAESATDRYGDADGCVTFPARENISLTVVGTRPAGG
jgi:DNA-binding CsgD family transcriptional regulator/SAM-dependent methyltransferase